MGGERWARCGQGREVQPGYQSSQSQIYNQDRLQPCRDGFAGEQYPSDVIIPTQNAWSKATYDQSVRQNFDFTEKDYDKAINRAAQKGTPVVAVFGSQSTSDTQKLIAGTIPAAQRSGRGSAVYIYVDTDNVDRNSALGKYVDQLNVRSQNLAFTMVFAMHPDARGTPRPDPPLMTAWGGRDEIASLIPTHIGYGLNNMRPYQGRFAITLPADAAALKPLPPASVPVRPDVVPVRPDVVPARPDAVPVRPDAVPVRPDAVPVRPDAVPVRPDAVPVRPDAVPVRPDAVPVRPDAVPVRPLPGDPFPALPNSPFPMRPLPGDPLPGRPLLVEPLPARPLPGDPIPAWPLPNDPRLAWPLPSDPRPAWPPPSGPLPADPVAKQRSLEAIADSLRRQQFDAVTRFDTELHEAGGIGGFADGFRNNLGSTAEGKSWYNPAALWSHFANSDTGSSAIRSNLQDEERRLDQLMAYAKTNDEQGFKKTYEELTGSKLGAAQETPVKLHSTAAAEKFHESQVSSVDGITDLAAALGAGLALRTGKSSMLARIGRGALIGGGVKSGTKALDYQYSRPIQDFVTGTAIGGSVVLGEYAGASASRAVGARLGLTVTGDLLSARIETQGTTLGIRLLSAATKSGTTGTVYGALENPTRQIINDLTDGKGMPAAGTLLAKTLEGGVSGFIGGTLLGMTFDGVADGFKRFRPGVPPSFNRTVNGVDVPPSGVVSLEEGAQILGTDPAALLAKAHTDPYGAVADAVTLYEKTGVNIQKHNPVTGQLAVPETFADALSTVQKVDLMTPGAAARLPEKVRIVQSTQQFIATNTDRVQQSLERLQQDANFREVVKLKGEQGGAEAAEAFEQKFRSGFEKDLKVGMAVESITSPSLPEAQAFAKTQAETEIAYLQKAADFFKDMTDPAQRQRLNQLVDEIFAKFTPASVSKNDLWKILDQFDQSQRPLAEAILEKSAATSSDVGLNASLKALRAEFERVTGSSMPGEVYTLTADSAGNGLGYLFRKSNGMSMPIHNIDALLDNIQSGYTPHSIVLFDDPALMRSLTQEQRQLLAKVPKIYIADIGSFDRSVNILDVALGPKAVSDRLRGLVAQADQIAKAQPHLIPKGVANELFEETFDREARALGPNVQVIRPPAATGIANRPSAMELAAMNPAESIFRQLVVPKASKEEIAGFLANYAGHERELAAQMLASGAVHNTFETMMRKTLAVQQKIESALASKGIKPEDLLIVTDKDPGGSTHLISYLYRRTSGLSAENFISSKQLSQLISSGQVHNKAIAYFDDTIYSGSQMTSTLDNNLSNFMPFKQVVVGTLGAYQKGITALESTHLAQIGNLTVASATTHQPFYSTTHPFFSTLDATAQQTVKQLGGSAGFGNVQGSLIWSYMYPDNNLEFFGHNFAGVVLGLPSS